MVNLDRFFKVILPNQKSLKRAIYNNALAGTYVVDGNQMKLIKAGVKKYASHLTHNGLADTGYEEIADRILLTHHANFTKNGSYLYNFYYGTYKKMSADDIKHAIALIVKYPSYNNSIKDILMQVQILLALSNKASQDIAYHTHSKLDVIEDIRGEHSKHNNFNYNIYDLTFKNCFAIKKYLNWKQLVKKVEKQLYSPYYGHQKDLAYKQNDINKLGNLNNYEDIFQGLNDDKTLGKVNDIEEEGTIKGQLVSPKRLISE